MSQIYHRKLILKDSKIAKTTRV